MSEPADPKHDASVDALLADVPSLAPRPDLVEVARGAFRFAQFLLDDEENLTRTGNLSGAAKERLRARTLELLGVEERDGEGDPT
ncbi:hypothetical protein [Sandaracinus amylolyticus]|uniref:hypothetical protein n=1 Tax=Sandaracinus amylolyticus TaxID=927083 RepID=UPI001F3598E6|nr:hypothetical protein [Sandaracinus amylolyticus]UJR81538.1 Hypothetical protein I5071_35980 [Sandaracinus amylolyticus]